MRSKERNRYINSRFFCAFCILVLSFVIRLSEKKSYAQPPPETSNPVWSSASVCSYPPTTYIHGGRIIQATTFYYVNTILWKPHLEPWICGNENCENCDICKTAKTSAGNRYETFIIPDNFPLECCLQSRPLDYPPDPLMNCPQHLRKTIKASDCKAFWDNQYPTHNFFFQATTAGNCHALTTGKKYPNDGDAGIGIILRDDWEQATISDLGEEKGTPGSCRYSYIPGGATIAVYGIDKTHSILITGKCGQNNEYITHTLEKFGTGPFYGRTFSCEQSVTGLGTYIYYRKKD